MSVPSLNFGLYFYTSDFQGEVRQVSRETNALGMNRLLGFFSAGDLTQVLEGDS
jgi:hypothetical protein